MYLKFRSLLIPILLFNASLYACGGESKNIVEKNESSVPQLTKLNKNLQKLILKHSFTDLDIADRIKRIASLKSVCTQFNTFFHDQDFRSDILSGCMDGALDSLGAYLSYILSKETRTNEEESLFHLILSKPLPFYGTIYNHFQKYNTTVANLKENPDKAKAYMSLLPLLCFVTNNSLLRRKLAEISEHEAFKEHFQCLQKEIKIAADRKFDDELDSSFIIDQLPKLIEEKLLTLNPHNVSGFLSALGREFSKKSSDCVKRVIHKAQMLPNRILSDFFLASYQRNILEAAQSGDISAIETFIQNNHTRRSLRFTEHAYLQATLLTELALLGSLLHKNDKISEILADHLLEFALEPTACNELLIRLILCTALLHKQEYVAHKLWNVCFPEWPRKSCMPLIRSFIEVTSQDRDSFSCACDLVDAYLENYGPAPIPRNLLLAVFDNDLEAIEEYVGVLQDQQLRVFYSIWTTLAGAQQNTALLSYISSRSPIGLHEVRGLKLREQFTNDTHCVTSVISAEMIKAELDDFMQGDKTVLLEDDAVSRFLRRFNITEKMSRENLSNPLMCDLHLLGMIEHINSPLLDNVDLKRVAYFLLNAIDLQNQEYDLDLHLRLLSWAIMKGFAKNCDAGFMRVLCCYHTKALKLKDPDNWVKLLYWGLYSDCLTFATPTLESMDLVYKEFFSKSILSQEWLLAAWNRSKEELIKHMPLLKEETFLKIYMLLKWAARTGRIELVKVLMENYTYDHDQTILIRDILVPEARAFGHEALAEFLEALHDENENEGE